VTADIDAGCSSGIDSAGGERWTISVAHPNRTLG
jgi:hypothetical protein